MKLFIRDSSLRDNFYIILCGEEIFRNRGSYIVSMEIMMLMLLYFLAQNPDFPESVKPLMGKLKNSEEMLKFLNDLSRFSEMFSLFQKQGKEKDKTPPPPPPPKGEKAEPAAPPPEEKEKPQSPTSGIADEFIEQCLERYFKKK